MSIEIYSPEIEKIEFIPKNISKKKEDIIKRQSNAHSFGDWLRTSITLLKHDGNFEEALFLEAVYDKYKEFYPKHITRVKILEGWKGNDQISIYETFNEDFVIECHNKDKESGEVSTTTHKIKAQEVNVVRKFISTWNIGEKHKCYDFASVLGENDWKEVWKKRTDVYFPKYYFPIKILEALGIIKYSGRGLITRLK